MDHSGSTPLRNPKCRPFLTEGQRGKGASVDWNGKKEKGGKYQAGGRQPEHRGIVPLYQFKGILRG